MATNTYVAIAEYTLGSNGGTVTFSNISQSYTDLRLVIKGGFVDSGFLLGARVGNASVDTSNYAYTAMRGNGSTATSAHKTGMVFGAICQQGGNDLNNLITVDFLNYSNTTTQKTWISRYGNAGDGTDSVVSTWRSTAAIDTIAIAECGDGGSGAFNYGNMLAGTTFTLYGIKAEGPSLKATGGAIYTDAEYYYHVFGTTGTFTPLQSLTADILVVAGGGGGGGASSGGGQAGGGGAGGLLEFASQALSATGYTVTVGSGGAYGATNSQGSNGGNSQFGALTTCIGGGGGGSYGASGGSMENGAAGGSGGGVGQYHGTGTKTGGAATSGQGNVGGGPDGAITNYAGGGGGGAGGPGGAAIAGYYAGDGGVGATSSLIEKIGIATGVSKKVVNTYYIAGGGGGVGNPLRADGGYGAPGGYGGGGAGAYYLTTTDVRAQHGISGTGSGGGGGSYSGNNSIAGNGGSGVVIVRYAK